MASLTASVPDIALSAAVWAVTSNQRALHSRITAAQPHQQMQSAESQQWTPPPAVQFPASQLLLSVCVCVFTHLPSYLSTHTHEHTRVYVYSHTFICIYVHAQTPYRECSWAYGMSSFCEYIHVYDM